MTTSTARVEANRRNALKSTGPRTEAGKAAARLNAFKHGMAGEGDVVGPGEDGQLVAERAEAFARELGAVGPVARLLAHRAAVLSVRMENLAVGDLLATQAAERRGRDEFDADRAEVIEELLVEANEPGADPAEALELLASCPDGLARLVAAWHDLRARLDSRDPGDAAEVAARWLGLRGEPGADLACRVEAEVARLRVRAGSMGGVARSIDRARGDAGVLARFNPSPAANLARRYEAAAERGMYRAMRAIADLDRQPGRKPPQPDQDTQAPSPATTMGPIPPLPSPPPGASLASFRTTGADPLASFRVGLAPSPQVHSPGPRTYDRRPDPRELAGSHP